MLVIWISGQAVLESFDNGIRKGLKKMGKKHTKNTQTKQKINKPTNKRDNKPFDIVKSKYDFSTDYVCIVNIC